MPGCLVADAELTVDDLKGRSSFERLHIRARTTIPGNVRRASRLHPARLYLFDLLAIGADVQTMTDVRELALKERKARLRDSFGDTQAMIFVSGIVDAGEWVFQQAVEHDLEGMIAKRLDRPYQRGRTRDWLKIKHAGYSRPAALGFGKTAG
ncbi:DNA ligase [Caballeronia sp. GaOx3]|uniref:ATP-dependent DNA ligase n=1 Tax=Caballeronia sp. GaOx3 TaxID=2921740 RepID=UPI002028679F|nr:DNA ligase [Caballeronia sp. GaOx3]